MRVTWLADVLHEAHCQLVPLDGWQGRGRELTTVNGTVWHHTATPPSTLDANVAKLLRDGRADLPGPLSQLGLDRQGRFWLIADGKANHNGYGMWGNQSIGIEAFNDGKGEAWTGVQVDAWLRGTAAILRHLRLNEGHCLGHKETDPGRKIDPKGIDMVSIRRQVAALLRPSEDDVFEPRIVTIPPPRADGAQVVALDVKGKPLGVFHHDVTATLKAENDGRPVRADVQVCAYGDALLLSFVGFDGGPVAQGNVEVILNHPMR